MSSLRERDVANRLLSRPEWNKKRAAFLLEMERFDGFIKNSRKEIEILTKRIDDLHYKIKHYHEIPQPPGGVALWDSKHKKYISDFLAEVIQTGKDLNIDQRDIYKNQILTYKQIITSLRFQIRALRHAKDRVISDHDKFIKGFFDRKKVSVHNDENIDPNEDIKKILKSNKRSSKERHEIIPANGNVKIVTREHSHWNKECQKTFQNIWKNWSKLCMKIKGDKVSGPALEWFESSMEEFAETQDTLIYIAEHGDVVGFVLGHEMIVPENEKAFYIELFCGPGLGRKLWAEIERHAKRKGYRLLALRAASEDKKLEKELIKYYESRGFKRVTNQCSKKRLSTRKAGLDGDVVTNGYWMTKCLE